MSGLLDNLNGFDIAIQETGKLMRLWPAHENRVEEKTCKDEDGCF